MLIHIGDPPPYIIAPHITAPPRQKKNAVSYYCQAQALMGKVERGGWRGLLVATSQTRSLLCVCHCRGSFSAFVSASLGVSVGGTSLFSTRSIPARSPRLVSRRRLAWSSLRSVEVVTRACSKSLREATGAAACQATKLKAWYHSRSSSSPHSPPFPPDVISTTLASSSTRQSQSPHQSTLSFSVRRVAESKLSSQSVDSHEAFDAAMSLRVIILLLLLLLLP
mmetsp:Transcript_16958/g.28984  ORF Transcript_16958/g.28984 Transcript_16958/m.28984 type:complete len:223 (+) Transcript_16958:49-717(+)